MPQDLCKSMKDTCDLPDGLDPERAHALSSLTLTKQYTWPVYHTMLPLVLVGRWTPHSVCLCWPFFHSKVKPDILCLLGSAPRCSNGFGAHAHAHTQASRPQAHTRTESHVELRPIQHSFCPQLEFKRRIRVQRRALGST